MHLFKKPKSKINTQAMMHLIYETIKTNSPTIFHLFDKINIVYNPNISLLVITIFNYELYRYELYCDNKKELVDLTMTKLYDYYFYQQNLNNSTVEAYKLFSKDTNDKIKKIYETKKLHAAKEDVLYHTFIEQMRIDETLISDDNKIEFIAYIKLWISQAKAINDTYTLDEDEINEQKSQYIDFRF